MTDHAILISVEIGVANAQSLWDIASAYYKEQYSPNIDEVSETIGPRHDPDIMACAALLFDPVTRRSHEFSASSKIIVSGHLPGNTPITVIL